MPFILPLFGMETNSFPVLFLTLAGSVLFAGCVLWFIIDIRRSQRPPAAKKRSRIDPGAS